MIIAELKGKIPSKLHNKEDLLTSNVFSFFKYSDRKIFKDYLSMLGIKVSLNESEKAEFIFWPSYEDGTEPDLIVICGKFYLLFEAKLYSDFSPQTSTTNSQIEREIEMGKNTAENIDKEFIYIAITAEYFKNKKKYQKYETAEYRFIWTNWQLIASFIDHTLENDILENNREFAQDLFFLLVKKRLRSFEGINNKRFHNKIKLVDNIFYNVATSKFKGLFSGFTSIFVGYDIVLPYEKVFHKTFFKTLNDFEISENKTIFYREKINE